MKIYKFINKMKKDKCMTGPLADSSMKVLSATVNLKKAISSLSINYSYDPWPDSFRFVRQGGRWKKLSTTGLSLVFDSLILSFSHFEVMSTFILEYFES